MAGRTDYFFRQKVTEAELDLAFELLEKADRNLAADLGIYGIVSGAEPTPHAPVADLTIDLTAPARAYDNLGQRIFFGTGQTVDCSVDHAGLPTEVPVAGEERWLGVFLRFERLLSNPRTDGNSQQVFFRRDESFDVVVRQGATAPAGAALKVPLQPDELLLCDVRRTNGQGQILGADIDVSRRQVFIFATGDAVAIISGAWNILQPAVETVQAALDETDAELDDHFTGAARRHPAGDVDYTPHGFVASATVQAAINELVDDLSSAAVGTPGASLLGADAVAGAPNALPAGHVDGQLSQLLAWLNAHLSAPAGAHNASAIAAAAHNYVSGASVQAQLQEIVDDLQSQAAGLGASQVGNQAVAGSPTSLVGASVKAQIDALVAAINARVVAAALASTATPGSSLVGADAVAGSPDALVAGTIDAQISTLLALVNARARKSGDTFSGNILPNATGLDLGSSGARWDAFLRDVNAIASAAGVAAVRGFAADGSTPAIRGSGVGFLVEGEGVEASHETFFIGTIKVWDLIRGWTFLPQHTGDLPDAVEINGVTQRNIVKAWGSVTSGGTLNAPHWNVASISKPGTGRYSVTLDVNPGSVNAVIVTVNSGALSADYSVHVFSPNGISFEVDINSAGTLTDLAFMFVVLGA